MIQALVIGVVMATFGQCPCTNLLDEPAPPVITLNGYTPLYLTCNDPYIELGAKANSICDGNLEEGSFRCDANVSVRPWGQKELGTRAELKNLNSFRFIKQAIEYEVERQIDRIEGGGKVVQETRLFDSDTGMTRSMRGKEEAHDYRYFPDPDLVPLVISEAWVDDVRATLPELPDAKQHRFVDEHGVRADDAAILTASR